MISTINLPEKKDIDFPKLMMEASSGVIVLFTNPTNGIVVDSGATNDPIGSLYRHLPSERFEDFNGTVTISN